MELINRLLFFVFIFCCLFIVKEIANVVLIFVDDNRRGNYTPVKMVLIGLAISYVVTLICKGFTF